MLKSIFFRLFSLQSVNNYAFFVLFLAVILIIDYHVSYPQGGVDFQVCQAICQPSVSVSARFLLGFCSVSARFLKPTVSRVHSEADRESVANKECLHLDLGETEAGNMKNEC